MVLVLGTSYLETITESMLNQTCVDLHCDIVNCFYKVEHIDQVDASGHPSVQISEGTVTLTEPNPALLMPPPQNLPPGCPTWAARLRDCEVSVK